MEYSIVVPAHNEALNLERFVNVLHPEPATEYRPD